MRLRPNLIGRRRPGIEHRGHGFALPRSNQWRGRAVDLRGGGGELSAALRQDE
jgi:hypothetical protein